ncbi:putative holin-like toxin [Xylocopilactobacillus apis]
MNLNLCYWRNVLDTFQVLSLLFSFGLLIVAILEHKEK